MTTKETAMRKLSFKNIDADSISCPQKWGAALLGSPCARETLINGVREWNREPSCSRFPHRGKEVPIEHVFRRFRVVPG
ncbi:hypothetical protein ACI2S5_27200, partial [Ralstonia nicotianae]